MGATTTLLTFEEFERLPDKPGKRELLKGELIELPPPESKHNRIGHRIWRRLDAAVLQAQERGEAVELGEVFMEMGYRLSSDGWVQPDVSITHRGQEEGKYIEGAPAIAIEVISPRNTAEEMATKTELYFQFGALEVWRIYRKARQVQVHVGRTSRLFLAHESITTPLLPGFACQQFLWRSFPHFRFSTLAEWPVR